VQGLVLWPTPYTYITLTNINLCLISTHIASLLYRLVGPEYELPDDVNNQFKQDLPQLVMKEPSLLCDGSEYVRTKTDPLPKYCS
jgi:hypothetical protein